MKYDDLKPRLSANPERFERVFFVEEALRRDSITAHLPQRISEQVCAIFHTHIDFLTSLILPDPNSIVETAQSGMVENSDEIVSVIKTIMRHIYHHRLARIQEDDEELIRQIALSLTLYDSTLKPLLLTLIERIEPAWQGISSDERITSFYG